MNRKLFGATCTVLAAAIILGPGASCKSKESQSEQAPGSATPTATTVSDAAPVPDAAPSFVIADKPAILSKSLGLLFGRTFADVEKQIVKPYNCREFSGDLLICEDSSSSWPVVSSFIFRSSSKVVTEIAIETTIDPTKQLEKEFGARSSCDTWLSGQRVVRMETHAHTSPFSGATEYQVSYRLSHVALALSAVGVNSAGQVRLGIQKDELPLEAQNLQTGDDDRKDVLFFKDGFLHEITTPFECPSQEGEIKEKLTRLFGKPAKTSKGLVWKSHVGTATITINDRLTVANATPVAVEPQEMLSEPTPLLGAKWKDVEARYGTVAEVDGSTPLRVEVGKDGQGRVIDRSGVIEYPEFDPITYDFWVDRSETVRGYIVKLHYGQSAEAREQMLKAITKRFGAGTPRSQDIELTDLSSSPRVWLRDNMRENRFEVVVGAVTEREYLEWFERH